MVDPAAANSSVVLVVDDEALVRMNAAAFLEDAGFTTIEAENAAEALEVMKARPDIDVLFTDVQMPGGVDGIELAREIHDRWPTVLLLITSGNQWPPQRTVPDHGHFLPKPYIAEKVISEIRALEREAAAR